MVRRHELKFNHKHCLRLVSFTVLYCKLPKMGHHPGHWVRTLLSYDVHTRRMLLETTSDTACLISAGTRIPCDMSGHVWTSISGSIRQSYRLFQIKVLAQPIRTQRPGSHSREPPFLLPSRAHARGHPLSYTSRSSHSHAPPTHLSAAALVCARPLPPPLPARTATATIPRTRARARPIPSPPLARAAAPYHCPPAAAAIPLRAYATAPRRSGSSLMPLLSSGWGCPRSLPAPLPGFR